MMPLCKCGCGKEILYRGYYKYYGIPEYISGHNWKGIKRGIRSEISKEKQSQTRIRLHIPIWNTGKLLSEGHKKKLKENHVGMTGKHHSLKTRQIISMCVTKENKFTCFKTKLYAAIRNSQKYKEWRLNIFKRDKFICKNCNEPGKYLNPHHIVPLYLLIKKFDIKTVDDAIICNNLWDIDNGITLCKDCHHLTDTFGAKVHFTTRV
jgi:5-methylcytosine-specific restriction endonuclease McrA